MRFRSSSIKIWLVVLAATGLGACTAMVQLSETVEVDSPVISGGVHSLNGPIKNLQNFLESVDSSETELAQLAAGDDGAEELLLDSNSDEILSDDLSGSSGDDPDSLLTGEDSDSLLDGADSSDGDELLQADDSDDLLSGDDDDLLLTSDDDEILETAEQKKKEEQKAKREEKKTATAEHEKLFLESRYPSANTCATCHRKQYEEWSVSQHAYAQLSPIYMAFQTTINMKTSRTNGDFCIRCHNPVGMNLGESLFISNLVHRHIHRIHIVC